MNHFSSSLIIIHIFKYDHLRIPLLSTTTLVYDNIEMDIQKYWWMEMGVSGIFLWAMHMYNANQHL
jgi:hypothetical protein